MNEPRRLDRSQPFGVVYGNSAYRFEQNGLRFDAQGTEILSKRAANETQKGFDAHPVLVRPTSAAARMRRSRERRRAGVVAVVNLEVTEQDVTALITRNLLRKETCADRAELSRAIRAALTGILAP